MLHEQMYFYGNEVNIQTSILMTDRKKNLAREGNEVNSKNLYSNS